MSARCSDCGQKNRQGAKYCLRCGARLGVRSSDLLGRVLAERYRIRSILGEGGMGRVYLAEQQLGTAIRNVAIKVLHAEHSDDATHRTRFHRECEVVVQLTHPNTIQFLDFGELPDGRLFIVMELVEGHSLADALLEGPMPFARVARILDQIAGSLGEAHARGVVHRDLKPDNILLTTRGDETDFVKVCDFGVAKRAPLGTPEASQLTLQGTVVGTLQYMSPEQLTGGEIDARSDLYSLGLIVFEMLTGARPFKASSPLEWATQHTTAEPASLDAFEASRGLPAETKRAVMRALSKLPTERQGSARQLAAEVIGERTPTPGLEGPGPEPRPVDVTADTQRASPAARRKPREVEPSGVEPSGVEPRGVEPSGVEPSGVDEPLELPVARGRLGWIAALGVGLLSLSAAAWALGVGRGEPPVDGDPSPIDGAPAPSAWIRIVHFEREVTDAFQALGPPDGVYAVVHPGGTLGLELAAGVRIATDGTPGPDIYIHVDEARSGHYRADVAVGHRQYTTVGTELVGSLPLDADQFGIRRIRYVRLKNRGTEDLYVDAVGAYATAPMDPDEASGDPPPHPH